jgi:hypothetical protein
MSRFLLPFALALLAPVVAQAGAAEDILATDRAFSTLSVAKGSNAAFLAYMADDARVFGTGNEPPILGKAEAIKRFVKSGNGDPKTNVLSGSPTTPRRRRTQPSATATATGCSWAARPASPATT